MECRVVGLVYSFSLAPSLGFYCDRPSRDMSRSCRFFAGGYFLAVAVAGGVGSSSSSINSTYTDRDLGNFERE